jgi:Xaa-Pro aminopeptidase
LKEDNRLETRINKLRSLFPSAAIDALLVMKPENRRYLSGFTGSAGYLLITETDAVLITDFRYVEQAAAEAPRFTIVQHDSLWETVRDQLVQRHVKRVGFEKEFVSFATFEQMKAAFADVDLVPAEPLVDQLRQVKDPDEIAKIRKAAEIVDQTFRHILHFLRPGVTEQDIALELETAMRKAGASGPSFQTIVASGKRSSLPHGIASRKLLESGDFVTLDFGAVYEGYCSDLTRTVVLGEPSEKHREIYRMVLEAQRRALEGIRPGMRGEEADALARRYIQELGYGEYFGHGLGHGLGLAIHEEPRLAMHVQTVLEPGMVVTVEPGIYLPDWGGVRIEDDIVITETGCDILTTSPKELLAVP